MLFMPLGALISYYVRCIEIGPAKKEKKTTLLDITVD